jgi:hypothetical protein
VSCGYRLTRLFSIVKLLNNYRSHPAVIRYPSERFYDGELEPCGEPSAINSCLNVELLGPSRYPVIFSAVEGHDMREASSPSFFNPEEVLQVKEYVQQLLADTRAVPRIGKFPFFPFGLNIHSQSSQKSLRILESSPPTVRNARSFAKH